MEPLKPSPGKPHHFEKSRKGVICFDLQHSPPTNLTRTGTMSRRIQLAATQT
jgi:hypothetical protein